MEISDCIDDFQEQLVYLVIAIIAEVVLCFLLSWNMVAIITCIVLSICLSISFLIDWCYLSRKIILDENGCSFVSKRSSKTFTWEEIYVRYIENEPYLFGDSEIPGDGIILSSKPVLKPTFIGPMTYCRFTNPSTSVFIRFASSSEKSKITAAKFLYRGFTANKHDLLSLLDITAAEINKRQYQRQQRT